MLTKFYTEAMVIAIAIASGKTNCCYTLWFEKVGGIFSQMNLEEMLTTNQSSMAA